MRHEVGRRLILGLALASAVANAETTQRDRVSGERLLATEVIESLALAAPTMSGAASVRVTHPTARGRFPVVILSQGARSTPAMYSRLAQHWAARGHVVIQPVPPELSALGADARNAAAPRRLPATVEARIGDIRFILGALGEIETRARVLHGRLDRKRIALAGHSTGALATLLAAGPKLVYLDGTVFPSPASGTFSPQSGERVGVRGAGIGAVVLIGDPSRSGIVPDASWRLLDKPTLLATGTNDEGELPASGTRPAIMFALADPPQAAPVHELFVRGMDVCLGGLFCRVQPGTTPDPAALSAIAEVTTAFLQASLGRKRAAEEWLRSAAPAGLANGRATLKVYP